MEAKRNRSRTAFWASAALFVVLVAAIQVNPMAQGRIRGPVDDSDRVVLAGNVHPLARPQFEVGAADPALPMERMVLKLRLSPEKRTELEALLARQQDLSSPDFHRWLTPEEFGERFGPSDDELAVVEGWLRSRGFRIESVAKGRSWIDFEGTAAQVEGALGTSIRLYNVGGVPHHANAADPSIPRALAPLVGGIVSLNDFPFRAMHTAPRPVSGEGIRPEFTEGSDHYLAPADFWTIYNQLPAFAMGYSGAGVTIAVVGRTHAPISDVTTFRGTMGLPDNPPVFTLNGPDPGDLGPDEDAEAHLDMEWSGAVAPSAAVNFVCSASTAATDGVILSAQYIVDNDLAPVMTASFGLCEGAMGETGNSFINDLWMQAASQGITCFVSSGDNGPAGCDSPDAYYGAGPAVSGLASTPYNVAVGGTQYMDETSPSLYWSSVNAPTTWNSALSFIPEQAWNESGAAAGCPTGDTCSGLWAGSGGASLVYSKPSWQVAPGVPADGMRDLPDVSLAAAVYDGYLVQTSNATYVFGGTSASSPSFAGIMALIVQKSGQRQGNANVRLYQLASAQYGGTGAVVFHDTTVGNNSVPGVTGAECGPGYDEATGLGSVNVSALLKNWSGSGSCPTIALTPSILPAATVGLSYSQSVGASGGTAPYTFEVTSGSLPSGLTLSPSGVLYGTPAASGSFSFTVRAADSDGCSGRTGFSITVSVPPPVIASIAKQSPFSLLVTGSNIQSGIKVLINGSQWNILAWKSTVKLKILGGSALKAAVPKGAPTNFTFVNPDGGTAAVSGWSWQ